MDKYTNLHRANSISLDMWINHGIIVEWGVLHSYSRMNDDREIRYPDFKTLLKINDSISKEYLSAHLCGPIANDYVNHLYKGIAFKNFNRIQLNMSDYGSSAISHMLNYTYDTVIFQHRTDFPLNNVQPHYLFDKSGGRGMLNPTFPKQVNENNFVGYAGGFCPDNIENVIQTIDATNYWVDMETGVRDENDILDLDRCEKVIEKIMNFG